MTGSQELLESLSGNLPRGAGVLDPTNLEALELANQMVAGRETLHFRKLGQQSLQVLIELQSVYKPAHTCGKEDLQWPHNVSLKHLV